MFNLIAIILSNGEGEFVIPADVVSMLGDGSSDAGSRMLERLIAEVRSNTQIEKDK